MEDNNIQFKGHAIVELFGHQQIAGFISEQSVGGSPFVRVDVPESDGQPAFTKFYGSGAIYSITPVDEATMRIAVERMRPRPVSIYLLPTQAGHYDDDDTENESPF